MQARTKLRHHNAAVQVPIGLEEDFKGLIDLVQMKAYYFHGSNGSVLKATALFILLLAFSCFQYCSLAYFIYFYCSEKIVTEEVPADMEAMVAEKRRELIEVVSEVDDKLAEAFLSDEPISSADLEVCG